MSRCIVISKNLYPESETYDEKLEINKEEIELTLRAIFKGTTDGLRLAVNVGCYWYLLV